MVSLENPDERRFHRYCPRVETPFESSHDKRVKFSAATFPHTYAPAERRPTQPAAPASFASEMVAVLVPNVPEPIT
ncbi:hypothetical protein ACFZC5_20240 [Nocardia gamkensis]|uniref:hypothetical protein n=1 Tax=Nocardia gamkensis TaxID=352869 RepID=UPI0036EC3007